MPTYVYHCDACDQTFEVIQRMSEDPLSACGCGEEGQVRRLLSAGAGVIFKGSGFYETDYKRPSSSGSEPKPSEPSAPASCSGNPSSCACATGGTAD
ncbi:MAG: FmdB family zinc ribbon protein [Sumerlaeia bacterium]